jgi:hypothetical protein
MPTDHRRRLDKDGTRLPIRPDRRQPGPQESIRSRQLRTLHRALQNTELMTKGQNLKRKGRSLARFSHLPFLTSSKSEKAKVWRNCPEFEKRKK